MIDTLKIAWGLFDRRMKIQSVALIVMIVITGALEAGGVGLIFPLFQLFSTPESMQSNQWISAFRAFLGNPAYDTFVAIVCVSIFLYFLFKSAVVFAATYLQNKFIWNHRHKMAVRLMEYYLMLPYSVHIRRNSAVFARNMLLSVDSFFCGTIMPAVTLAAEIMVAAFVVAVLFIAEPLAALSIGILLGVSMMLLIKSMRRSLLRLGNEANSVYRAVLSALNHTFGPIKEIKVLRRERYFIDQYRRLDERTSFINLVNAVLRDAPRPILEVLAVGSLIGIALSVVEQGKPIAEAIPILGIFGTAAFRLMPAANRIANLINTMTFNRAGALQIQSDLRDYDRIRAGRHARPSKPSEFSHSITFDAVSYVYQSSAPETESTELEPAIQSISFTVLKGQSVALVGRSGAGKSTLANLLLGLLKPDSGRILVDGREISANDTSWMSRVGFVPQDTFIMDSSVRNNIAFGIPDDEIDPARVREAVTLAQLDQLVASLPEGLETLVGERGIRLSGGERQRLAIARALYCRPDVLVLDEATSSLDGETESEITEAINLLRDGKTLLIIAHRLSTVRNCDCVYWMESGRIVDSGSFGELYKKNADFRTMVGYMNVSESLPSESGIAAGTKS